MDTQPDGGDAPGSHGSEERSAGSATSPPRALRALGWAVRKRRTALELSQEGLGEAAGLHRNYVGGIERGEQNPSYLNLRKLARGLDLSLADLAGRAEAEAATLT